MNWTLRETLAVSVLALTIIAGTAIWWRARRPPAQTQAGGALAEAAAPAAAWRGSAGSMAAFLSSLIGRSQGAPPSPPVREVLFGDVPLDQWPAPGRDAQAPPWDAFVHARDRLAAGDRSAAIAEWRRIAGSGLEPRHKLQAWHFLRQHGVEPEPPVATEVLGVVVEVAMAEGLDLVAAYADGSARYYNFSGAGVVWEHPDASLDPLIYQLLSAASEVVAQIGPWVESRPPAPPQGQARLSFLTPSGLHFGQGDFGALARDPLGARTIGLATKLMQALTTKSRPK